MASMSTVELRWSKRSIIQRLVPACLAATLLRLATDSLCCSSIRSLPSPSHLHLHPITSTLRSFTDWSHLSLFAVFSLPLSLSLPFRPPPYSLHLTSPPTLLAFLRLDPAHLCVIGSCSQQRTTYHPDNSTLPSKPRRIVQLFTIPLASTVSSSAAPRSTAIIRCPLRG
jgi:hypothetical protein